MENAYSKETDARIVGKEFKNNMWHIQLDRTIFYPDLLGGQPRDFGTINGEEVNGVYEEDKNIYHIIEKNINTRDVKLMINWDHRFDMMQQHSGQHLLSSCFKKLLNTETIGFHLGLDSSTIDLNLKTFSLEESHRVEALANKIIQANFPIKSYFLSLEEALNLGFEDLPSYEDNIRILEIENIDSNPCGGTHVNSTGEIGMVKIIKWVLVRKHIRIEFLCGNRALEDYSKKTLYLNELNQILSSKDRDITYKVQALYYRKEELEKENRILRDEVNKYKAETILKGSKTINGVSFIIKTFKNIDLKEVNSIAGYLNRNSKLIQIYGLSNNNSGQFLLSKSIDLDIDLKDVFSIVKGELNLKGGGSSQTIQGGTDKSKLELTINRFYEMIKSYYSR